MADYTYIDVSHTLACSCPACTGMANTSVHKLEGVTDAPTSDAGNDAGGFGGRGLINPEHESLDPRAGGTYRGNPIFSLDQVEEQLNRTGYDWYTNNYNELGGSDRVLNFGFWNTQQQLIDSYYVNDTGEFAFAEVSRFVTLNEAQRGLARDSIQLWDDLIAIGFKETRVENADVTFGNINQPGTQAYAYLPFGNIYDDLYEQYYDWSDIGRLSGDVWIGFQAPSNFNPIADSYYSKATMVHEIGHAIGLSHPGDYDASDDGEISYEASSDYAQDSRQYTTMSYWEAYETGAQHIDWQLLNFSYSATPLVHDIAAIQAIYGADTRTRADNTVYGFNSTAGRSAFDFSVNTRPVVSIYDAGGTDTLNFSGWNTPSVIDLNEGMFSSGGGTEEFLTLEQVNANRAALGFAARSQATYDFYEGLKADLGLTSGLFKDNISIAYGTVIENAVGGGGDDRIIVNAAANRIDGGMGLDTVSYETSERGVAVSLDGSAGTKGGKGDVLVNVENLIGSSSGDVLSGNGEANRITGGLGDDRMTGGGGADAFVFETRGKLTGSDTISDFGRGDVIVTDVRIADRNDDGVLETRRGTLQLDSDGDSVRLTGVGALRYLGQRDGEFFYGNGDARPDASRGQLVYESTSADETYNPLDLTQTDIFFYDTSVRGPGNGDDRVSFSDRDLFVTTTQVPGGSDGDLDLGAGGVLDLPGSGGSVTFLENGGAALRSLEYDGAIFNGGVTYYVYSMQGSSVGTADLFFDDSVTRPSAPPTSIDLV